MKSLQRYEVNFEYHHKVQGFVYSLLKNTKYDSLHDKKGYKFFCFSNIYKSKTTGEHNLIISSPSVDFITQVEYQLQKIIDNQIPVELGSLFELKATQKIPIRNLLFPLQLITQSPIVLRIPVEKYLGKTSMTAPYSSIMWRSSHPVELFIETLENNLRKKFLDSTGVHYIKKIFETFEFKKQVSTKVEMNNIPITIIGSLWQLGFSSSVPHVLQLFGLDCGLGERNSQGFGFVNPIMQKSINPRIS